MKLIELTHGQVTIVDEDKYEDLVKFNWYAAWDSDTKSYYAVRGIYHQGCKRITERVHRWLTAAPSGVQVDHINGDTLDNRLKNLRLATARENGQNRHCIKSSMFPGVCFGKNRDKWLAQIQINGKRKHIGRFMPEREAFSAYLKSCKSNGFSIDFMVKKFANAVY